MDLGRQEKMPDKEGPMIEEGERDRIFKNGMAWDFPPDDFAETAMRTFNLGHFGTPSRNLNLFSGVDYTGVGCLRKGKDGNAATNIGSL
jgi:hypothetical protein